VKILNTTRIVTDTITAISTSSVEIDTLGPWEEATAGAGGAGAFPDDAAGRGLPWGIFFSTRDAGSGCVALLPLFPSAGTVRISFTAGFEDWVDTALTLPLPP